jgi:hypothetical protein
MNTLRILKTLIVLAVVIGIPVVLASCGGDDPVAPNNVNPPGGSDDFITMSVNGGPLTTYIEASGLPNIDCDPRVDWSFNQVVGWANFTNGSGPNGYDLLFDIMFPGADTVGTYTVQGDWIQAVIYDGVSYGAGPGSGLTSGTVQVTRSDTRIEGTYTFTAIDSLGTLVDFAGAFGVEAGFSLSCP